VTDPLLEDYLRPRCKIDKIKGLCFNCDEKFVPGHRCKKLFVIEGTYTAEEEWKETDPIEIEDKPEDEPVISIYALTGTPSPQTMRIHGALGKLSVTVLMDSGSTHNFINAEVAQQLGLKPTHFDAMQVMVASGEKLRCTGMCAGLLLWLQGELFVIDFFLLPMDVCEVVLGTQWLRTLGPIWWDFKRLQMNFSWKGRRVDLRGLKPPVHQVVDNRVMDRERKRRKVGWLCHIMPTR
jgi:hypothetical protein